MAEDPPNIDAVALPRGVRAQAQTPPLDRAYFAPDTTTTAVTQRRISYILLALLSVIVVSALLARITGAVDTSGLKDVTSGLLTPIVGLVGAVTGFYFGGQQQRGL